MAETVFKARSVANDMSMPRLTALRVVTGLLLVVAIALLIAWLSRTSIADEALRRAFVSRDVQASYKVKSIGLRWERIENLRIGDPARPDLTADWAEVRISAGWGRLSATAVRAGGVRLRGRIVDGRLTLGEVDKLLPKSDGKTPLMLPNLDVDIADARVSIVSQLGQIDMRIDGEGNLANGFAGKIAAVSPSLRIGDCIASRATANVNVVIRNRKPAVTGPVTADLAQCGNFVVAKPELGIEVALNAAFDRWRGTAAVKAQGAGNASVKLSYPAGRVVFEGDAANTSGSVNLAAATGRVNSTGFSSLGVKGRFSTAGSISGRGKIEIGRLRPDAGIAKRLENAARQSVGTPVAAFLKQVSASVRGAAAGIAVSADAAFAGGSATISRLSASGSNGAVLRADGGTGMRFGAAGFAADTQLLLTGGGFPTVRSTLQRRLDGMTLGIAQIEPFLRDGSRVAFDSIRFAASPSGAMRFETTALLDGPISGGRVEGLRLPVNATIAANGNMIVNNGCTTVAFRMLMISGLKLNPASLRLCPVKGGALVRTANGTVQGGASIAAPRLTGVIGNTPVQLGAGQAQVLLVTNGFAISRVAARLGTSARLSLIDIGALNGSFVDGAVRGRFTGISGKIGNVPLLVEGGAGEWTLRNGALALNGAITVSDEAIPGRFNPLGSDDVVLQLVNGRINATATLRSSITKTNVTKVVIAHNLGAGTGTAVLGVSDLRFSKDFQPEEVTRLTLGVIANVRGAMSGRGDIRWSPKGVTSTGRFATEGMAFAAAFGPVTGLKGEVVFDDLLALSTPAGQRVTIGTVNPGTPIADGVVEYRLLPGQRVAIERGTWPFAGGELLLDPTILEMGRPSERRLVFRVVGLDAAKFIQRFEFDNLAATGIFDGILPMYFNENGGRIEGGRVVVRRGGGTLAYVGEVSNAKMNVYAKLAFDALKSIRYNNLTISLNGPLDGEIVSQINFDGINEAPLSPPKSFIARQFIGLPFIFNIKVTAPFRSLLNTARTFQDPSSLLQRTVPELRAAPVQPAESENKR